jgi:hypothetical protein
MKKKNLFIFITIIVLHTNGKSSAQVSRLNNTSTGATEYIGWDGNILATQKDLDIQNNYGSKNINLFTFNSSLTKRMTILSTGEVGIGNFTPGYLLDVDGGDININTATNGYIDLTLPTQVYNHSFYIVVKHRNSLETWSTYPVNFKSTIIYYDFTTSLTKAYGNNLADLPDENLQSSVAM